MDDLKTEIKGKVLAIKDLPTLPTVLDEVSKLMEDPDVSTEKVAKCISMDQVLSAKVLKMVNSPIYGFPGRISSVSHALVLLGFNVIRGIIISTSVFDVMVENMRGLWEHSLGCAMTCGAVAQAAGIEESEEFTVAGLLHDLGKVVTAVQLPDIQKQLEDKVEADDLTWFEAERAMLGFGHDRINAWVADHWRLPGPIKEGMTYHHFPERARHYPQMAAAVHIADFLVRIFEFGTGGDDQVPALHPAAFRALGIKPADLEPVMDEMSERIVEISDFTF